MCLKILQVTVDHLCVGLAPCSTTNFSYVVASATVTNYMMQLLASNTAPGLYCFIFTTASVWTYYVTSSLVGVIALITIGVLDIRLTVVV